MPSSVVLEQLRPGAALASPLPEDVAVILHWSVQDEHGRPIHDQSCSVTVAAGTTLTADVPVAERKCVFRLGKGAHIAANLTAEITVNLGARGAHGAGALTARIEISSESINEADADASKTVYGELNQELRRSRTLYETFLVVVTGAMATVFSKRSDIAGAHGLSITIGLLSLALIVIYMIWQVAERYRKIVASLSDIERSWGLRSGPAPGFVLQEESDLGWKFWTKPWRHTFCETQIRHGAWRHTFWALGLTAYAVVAIGVVIAFLYAPAAAAKTPLPAPAANAACSCPTPAQTSIPVAPPDVAPPPKPTAGGAGRHQRKPAGS